MHIPMGMLMGMHVHVRMYPMHSLALSCTHTRLSGGGSMLAGARHGRGQVELPR